MEKEEEEEEGKEEKEEEEEEEVEEVPHNLSNGGFLSNVHPRSGLF